jgi:hypothetical protein
LVDELIGFEEAAMQLTRDETNQLQTIAKIARARRPAKLFVRMVAVGLVVLCSSPCGAISYRVDSFEPATPDEGGAVNRPVPARESLRAGAKYIQRASRCAEQLTSFISELDDLLDHSQDVLPLREAIGRHFPLYGCEIDQALEISHRSRHFDHAESHLKDVVIIFRRAIPRGWGFKVSFGLSKSTGNSELPAAMVDKGS